MQVDATHDPALRSWVHSANEAQSDFPIQNLPFGRFRRAGSGEPWRIGVAIGREILDLRESQYAVRWSPDVAALMEPLANGDLNALMGRSPAERRSLRRALSAALSQASPQAEALAGCLVHQADAEFGVACSIGDYTDFYTGIHHATAVGRLMRPDNPLLPNYKWVPIGYHGRASSIVPSGTPVRRPAGQTMAPDAAIPAFGPSARLDYELELGFLVAQSNALGTPIPISEAEDHLFGVLLLNDWSARDVQAWEYQPLGPFLAKSFATTLSPWVVTLEALAPFRAPLARGDGDPQSLPHLDSEQTRQAGALDISLEAWLQTGEMRRNGVPPVRIAASNAKDAAYWTPAQLIAHHSSNGCNLQAGDLLGSGTLSGPQAHQAGSLLEATRAGKDPLQLPGGEMRTFLQDGDTVTLRASCHREGRRRIGFGECTGTVLPAVATAARDLGGSRSKASPAP